MMERTKSLVCDNASKECYPESYAFRSQYAFREL